MNTLQQEQLKLLNGLADDMPIEMNAGQLRALLATARAEGAAEERKRAVELYQTLQLQGFLVSAAEFSIALGDFENPRTLTKKQKEIFEYLLTVEQIKITDSAKHFNMSINAMYSHLLLLVKKGKLKHFPNQTPAFEVFGSVNQALTTKEHHAE